MKNEIRVLDCNKFSVPFRTTVFINFIEYNIAASGARANILEANNSNEHV